ncbi:MAG: hypothetical protein AAF628_34080 [Planctomycetota bacterium]
MVIPPAVASAAPGDGVLIVAIVVMGVVAITAFAGFVILGLSRRNVGRDQITSTEVSVNVSTARISLLALAATGALAVGVLLVRYLWF